MWIIIVWIMIPNTVGVPKLANEYMINMLYVSVQSRHVSTALDPTRFHWTNKIALLLVNYDVLF